MRINLFIFVTAFFVFFLQNAYAVKVDPELSKIVYEGRTEKISALVHLKGQLDLEPLSQTWSNDNGESVAEVLENYHQYSFHKLTNSLSSAWVLGRVYSITHLWITNSLSIVASPEAIHALMLSNEVESIELEKPKQVHTLPKGESTYENLPSWDTEISWAAEKVGATTLWKKGFKGKGVLVAMIDTGATVTHPDLSGNVWSNPGETGKDSAGKDKANNGKDDDDNGYIDDVVGYDFIDKDNEVNDEHGHGTQTAGIVAGNGKGGTQTGIAPEATVMILKSCCTGGSEVFESSTWAAIQYAVKMKARVISMSLSLKPYSNPSYAKWRRLGEVVLKANIIHINSAGNLGGYSTPRNIGAPANNPPAWFHSKQTKGKTTAMITIGATDEDDKIRSYSSRGPVTWEDIEEYKDYPYKDGDKPGLIKPEVCGPSEMPSLSKDGETYTKSFGGTSSATPAIAGVAALLLSAKPELGIVEMTEVLQMSAKEVSSPFNNDCGAGRVDAVKALEYAMEHFKDK